MENTNGTVGIVNVNSDAGADVSAVDGGVAVSVSTPKDIAVYDITGRKLGEVNVHDIYTFALPKGIYVVEGVKVFVK
jgi:hypothetical protein